MLITKEERIFCTRSCEERMFMTCNLPGYSKSKGNLLERGEGVVCTLLGPFLCLSVFITFVGFSSGFSESKEGNCIMEKRLQL